MVNNKWQLPQLPQEQSAFEMLDQELMSKAEDLNEKLGVILAVQPDFITGLISSTEDASIIDLLFQLKEAIPITDIDKHKELIVKCEKIIDDQASNLVGGDPDPVHDIEESKDDPKQDLFGEKECKWVEVVSDDNLEAQFKKVFKSIRNRGQFKPFFGVNRNFLQPQQYDSEDDQDDDYNPQHSQFEAKTEIADLIHSSQSQIEAHFKSYSNFKQNSFIVQQQDSVFSLDFLGPNKARLTNVIDQSQHTIQRLLANQIKEQFTFRQSVNEYKSGTQSICQSCYLSRGLQMQDQSVSQLCAKCYKPGQYLLEKQGSKYLVDSSDLQQINAEIVVQSGQQNTEQFCLLDEIQVAGSKTIEVGLESIEGKFVKFCFESTIQTNQKVRKIEKIKNKTVQMRFINELNIIKDKNPHKSLGSMIKMLFHGTSTHDPKEIVTQEVGLDMRYANKGGQYGAGIYFADNALYSNTYAYQGQQGSQMLLCFVIVGDSYIPQGFQNQQFVVPPKRADWQHYDSVNGAGGSHFIIYDNNKQYPCYLITYR